MPIVMIVPTVIKIEPYKPHYAILLNKSLDDICKFATENQKCLVFTFLLQPPTEDYSAISEHAEASHMLYPHYIGDFRPSKHVETMEAILIACFGADTYSSAVCIYSDVPELPAVNGFF